MSHDEQGAGIDLQLDAALKSLPVLHAPASLQLRVMAAVQSRQQVPWHRQAWTTWSLAARSLALGVMLAVFALLCFAAYLLPGLAPFQDLKNWVGSGFSTVTALWQAVAVLAAAASRVVQTVPTPWLLGSFAAAILGYFACMALGTVYIRLAMSTKKNI